MIQINAFLTAYDPSDLPGSSIDPLGFERGYLLLADKILPGLTNVANRPRYFGVLCAGVMLAEIPGNATPRQLYHARLESVQRLERLWALANILATQQKGEAELPTTGIRGLRYARRKHAELELRRATSCDANFQLLIRQIPYGIIGIYGAIGERLRFLFDRKTLELTPDLGEKLGEAFARETDMPGEVRDAVRRNRPVGLSVLQEWGKRAHVSGDYGSVEAECLQAALDWNPTRSRMAELLNDHPRQPEETELDRLERIEDALGPDPADRPLLESLRAATRFERGYAPTLLAFERLLWLCRQQAGVPLDDAARDRTMTKVRKALPALVRQLHEAVEDANTAHFCSDMDRLADVLNFLRELAAAHDEPEAFVRLVLKRHTDVQKGKFDNGRRKAPWIELRGDVLSLTSTRIGGAQDEITDPAMIVPHFYRTNAADALTFAGATA